MLAGAAGADAAGAGAGVGAAAGAGALGVGFGAAMAPVLVLGKQVTSQFEEITTAYEALKKAQKDGTEESKKQAQELMKNLTDAERAMVGSLGRIATVRRPRSWPAGRRPSSRSS